MTYHAKIREKSFSSGQLTVLPDRGAHLASGNESRKSLFYWWMRRVTGPISPQWATIRDPRQEQNSMKYTLNSCGNHVVFVCFRGVFCISGAHPRAMWGVRIY